MLTLPCTYTSKNVLIYRFRQAEIKLGRLAYTASRVHQKCISMLKIPIHNATYIHKQIHYLQRKHNVFRQASDLPRTQFVAAVN